MGRQEGIHPLGWLFGALALVVLGALALVARTESVVSRSRSLSQEQWHTNDESIARALPEEVLLNSTKPSHMPHHSASELTNATITPAHSMQPTAVPSKPYFEWHTNETISSSADAINCTDQLGLFLNQWGNPKPCSWLNNTLSKMNRNCGTDLFPITDLGKACRQSCSAYNLCANPFMSPVSIPSTSNASFSPTTSSQPTIIANLSTSSATVISSTFFFSSESPSMSPSIVSNNTGSELLFTPSNISSVPSTQPSRLLLVSPSTAPTKSAGPSATLSPSFKEHFVIAYMRLASLVKMGKDERQIFEDVALVFLRKTMPTIENVHVNLTSVTILAQSIVKADNSRHLRSNSGTNQRSLEKENGGLVVEFRVGGSVRVAAPSTFFSFADTVLYGFAHNFTDFEKTLSVASPFFAVSKHPTSAPSFQSSGSPSTTNKSLNPSTLFSMIPSALPSGPPVPSLNTYLHTSLIPSLSTTNPSASASATSQPSSDPTNAVTVEPSSPPSFQPSKRGLDPSKSISQDDSSSRTVQSLETAAIVLVAIAGLASLLLLIFFFRRNRQQRMRQYLSPNINGRFDESALSLNRSHPSVSSKSTGRKKNDMMSRSDDGTSKSSEEQESIQSYPLPHHGQQERSLSTAHFEQPPGSNADSLIKVTAVQQRSQIGSLDITYTDDMTTGSPMLCETWSEEAGFLSSRANSVDVLSFSDDSSTSVVSLYTSESKDGDSFECVIPKEGCVDILVEEGEHHLSTQLSDSTEGASEAATFDNHHAGNSLACHQRIILHPAQQQNNYSPPPCRGDQNSFHQKTGEIVSLSGATTPETDKVGMSSEEGGYAEGKDLSDLRPVATEITAVSTDESVEYVGDGMCEV